MIELDFAERLRTLRRENDLTQEKLADILQVTQRKISYWESGKFEPDLISLWKIADFFDISIDILIGRKNF
ncbi:MAG: helix-turn-helix transcriptional regulator [Clostridia bacterium]|nr:helix-turn-helix transcriptional regulator [Clostridia bacterium]